MASLTEIKKKNKVIGYKFRGTYIDADGKRMYKSHSWYSEEDLTPAKMRRKAQAEADEWEINLRAEAAKEVRRPQEEPPQERGMTFQEYATNMYLPSRKERGCRPITIQNYERDIRIISERIGEHEISKLTPWDTRDLLNYLQNEYKRHRDGKPLDKSTVKAYYNTYKQIVKWAMDNDILSNDPLRGITPPTAPKKPVNALNTQEVRQLLNYLDNAPIKKVSVKEKTFILICLFTGLRKSEIFGLKWGAIDFDRKQISVEQGVTTITGGKQIADPKTATSRRVVPLHQKAIDALRGLYGTDKHDPREYVFHSQESLYEPMHTVHYSDKVKEICVDAGLPAMSPHDLRHTFATMLNNNGVDLKSIQTALGHSNSSITNDMYIHVSTEHIASGVCRTFDNIMGVTA